MISTPQADRLLRRLLRMPAVRRQADRLYRWYGRYLGSLVTQIQDTIPEATPLRCRVAAGSAPRLNLLVPSVAKCHVYGGIATALEFFESLAPCYPRLRILVTDAPLGQDEIVSAFRHWPCLPHGEVAAREDRVIVGCADRRFSIEVEPHDHFIATAWWTARIAHELVAWQKRQYGVSRRYAYLIQDYEPGFYPWSSRYALALATYGHPQRTIAIFNSQLLYDYFRQQGHIFDPAYVFEPRLHPRLRCHLPPLDRGPRRKRIVVYGRPGVERNAFPILVQSIKSWSANYPGACTWEVVSAGEPHADIDLGHGLRLISLGKLSLDDYASLLADSCIGISLMISPHPSYPPLEMAAFGLDVITNRYANKDLSKVHDRILSVDPLEPEVIAANLTQLCRAHDEGRLPIAAGGFRGIDFLGDGPVFPFIPAIQNDFEFPG